MGVVIQFPRRHRTEVRRCDLCIHSVAGSQTYCLLYQEVMLNERSAEDCGEFIDDESRD